MEKVYTFYLKVGMRSTGSMDIFICMNSDEEREEIRSTIEKSIFKKDLDMKIVKESNNPYEILNIVKKRKEPAMYFLNICFDAEINGIKLGAQIREYDKLGVIVYITPHLEMVYLSYLYKVEALDYIIRDDFEKMSERLEECLERANKKLNVDNEDLKKFKIKYTDRIVGISKNEIIYFETSEKPHKIILHSENEELEFKGKLKEIENSIGEEFFRCHKSYLININKIQEINMKDKTVLLDNGDSCLVSKKAMTELIEKL